MVVYIDTPDIEESVKRTLDLGGKVLVGPISIPTGEFAWIQDPTGTTMGLWETTTG